MIKPPTTSLSLIVQSVPEESVWSSLEIIKIIVSVLMPVSVVVFGWFLNRRLKHIEHRQWANHRLIEKRLELYDEIAPELNKLLCFFIFVGPWKNISPKQALEAKRFLDQKIHIYRYLLSEDFYNEYQSFIKLLFKQWQGQGVSASFRSKIATELGSRIGNSHYEWDSEWESWFTEEDAPTYTEVEVGYAKVMNAFKDTIEIFN